MFGACCIMSLLAVKLPHCVDIMSLLDAIVVPLHAYDATIVPFATRSESNIPQVVVC